MAMMAPAMPIAATASAINIIESEVNRRPRIYRRSIDWCRGGIDGLAVDRIIDLLVRHDCATA